METTLENLNSTTQPDWLDKFEKSEEVTHPYMLHEYRQRSLKQGDAMNPLEWHEKITFPDLKTDYEDSAQYFYKRYAVRTGFKWALFLALLIFAVAFGALGYLKLMKENLDVYDLTANLVLELLKSDFRLWLLPLGGALLGFLILWPLIYSSTKKKYKNFATSYHVGINLVKYYIEKTCYLSQEGAGKYKPLKKAFKKAKKYEKKLMAFDAEGEMPEELEKQFNAILKDVVADCLALS